MIVPHDEPTQTSWATIIKASHDTQISFSLLKMHSELLLFYTWMIHLSWLGYLVKGTSEMDPWGGVGGTFDWEEGAGKWD